MYSFDGLFRIALPGFLSYFLEINLSFALHFLFCGEFTT